MLTQLILAMILVLTVTARSPLKDALDGLFHGDKAPPKAKVWLYTDNACAQGSIYSDEMNPFDQACQIPLPMARALWVNKKKEDKYNGPQCAYLSTNSGCNSDTDKTFAMPFNLKEDLCWDLPLAPEGLSWDSIDYATGYCDERFTTICTSPCQHPHKDGTVTKEQCEPTQTCQATVGTPTSATSDRTSTIYAQGSETGKTVTVYAQTQ